MEMNYHNRKYVFEIETYYGVRFPKQKSELEGKGKDDITEAQKRKLWALGVNVSGIRFKGTACAVIDFIEEKRREEQERERKPQIFHVIYVLDGEKHESKTLYKTKEEAEESIRKQTPQAHDVMVVRYTKPYWMTRSGKCFVDRADAIESGEDCNLFVCPE